MTSPQKSAFNQPGLIDGIMNSMRGGDPSATLKPFIQLGNKAMIEPMLEKIDLIKYGADLLQLACSEGKKEIVDLLVSKGADILSPPESVTSDPDYRRSPFSIQAARSGDLGTLEVVLKNGGSLTD